MMKRMINKFVIIASTLSQKNDTDVAHYNFSAHLPPWLSGLAVSGRGAVKASLAIRQGVGSYPTPAGMSSQVSA